jgi:hypothetical protein
MKKSYVYLMIALTGLLLQGCTAQNESASQNYRPKGVNKAWRISGTVTTNYEPILGTGTTTLKVYINGEKAVEGVLSSNYGGEFSGSYKKHDIQSICSGEPKTANWVEVRCLIMVDDEKATTLIL